MLRIRLCNILFFLIYKIKKYFFFKLLTAQKVYANIINVIANMNDLNM